MSGKRGSAKTIPHGVRRASSVASRSYQNRSKGAGRGTGRAYRRERRGTLASRDAMCRALKILCAAPTPERLAELKRATVTVHWELVGGATSVDELAAQIEEWNPDVVVFDKSFGPDGEAPARRAKDAIRVIVV